jgi:hypothetical protein
MSSDSSRAQSALAGGVVQLPFPVALIFVNLAVGSLQYLSKVTKSLAASGLSYASTKAMAP